jgi:antitoxin component YwqK of YwqJK toxin-antitoxin module
MSEQRITVDDVDYDDYGRVLHEGRRVDGQVWEIASDGRVISEFTYQDGVQDGPTRLYRPTGELESEQWYDFGSRVRVRKWHPNGQLSRDETYRGGVLQEARAWAADGTEVDPATQP